MVSVTGVGKEKKVSKTLSMNEKRAMYSILGFLMIVNRDGLLDDTKTHELMEHLPLFQTVSEKKAFLSQEMFDMKILEKDVLKPMILEQNQKKKQEKKKKGKAVSEEGEEVKVPAKKKGKAEVSEIEHEKKKRGRKAKQQIVECNTEVNVNAGNSQEDQLADLVSQLTTSRSGGLSLQHPDEIELSDLDEVLSNLEEKGEISERVKTPKLMILEEKVKKVRKTSKK